MDVRGKVVFVSGANRGLGKALVEGLVAAGAKKVYAGARKIDGLHLPGAELVKVDIIDSDSVQAAARKCPDVDILINNAGYLAYGPLLAEDSVQSLRDHLEVNTIGTLLMAKAFAPILEAQGGGAMINILSVLSWLNIDESGPYSASKSAQWSLTNGLRRELASQGTLVIGIHPGYIDTDMAAGVDAPKNSPEEVVKLTLDGLANDIKEIIINDEGRWVKSSLSSADAAYLS